MRARVRGIYATALTCLLLDAGHEVVQASPPIRRRFDAALPAVDHDIAIETTDDRQGIGVVGNPEPVEAATDLLRGVGIDTFTRADPTPRGAVFDGRVTETLGGGAVLNLGNEEEFRDAEGYLPFASAEGHVEEDDCFRVQVVESRAPWVDGRPELDTQIRAMAGLATIVSGREGTHVAGGDDASARELAGITDLLDPDIPEGWGIEWSHDARDAGMDELGNALERAIDHASALDPMLDESVGEPGRIAASRNGAWVWFGRESRFALDEIRRSVTTTMPGHHRTKAATSAASAGVDLAEALCSFVDDGDAEEFPFAVVADQFGPNEGDAVDIEHGKPDGQLITLGRGDVLARDDDGTVSVRREMSAGGTYDALDARREAGDIALTTFREGRWWYPTVYRSAEGERKGTYVNVCTSVEVFPERVRYVDLHVDVVKHADGRVERVDDDELDAAVAAGEVSEPLAEKARSVATAVENAL